MASWLPGTDAVGEGFGGIVGEGAGVLGPEGFDEGGTVADVEEADVGEALEGAGRGSALKAVVRRAREEALKAGRW